MNNLLAVLMLAIVLATLKVVVMALGVMLLLALLYSFITRPRDTLVLLGCLGLFGLASAQPLACIIILGVVSVLALLTAAWRGHPRQLLLTDRRERH